MNEGDLAVFAREALVILFKLAGPILVVGLIVGFVAIALVSAMYGIFRQVKL